MKKKVYALLIVSVMIISIFAFASCSKADITNTDEAILSGHGVEISIRLESMAKDYRDRRYGSEGEAKFAEYVKDELLSYGYKDMSYVFEYKDTSTTSGEIFKSTNVVAVKDNPTSDNVVLITSSLDNVYELPDNKNEAIYNGLTGVAIMLELAETLKDIDLPYDVYFVGFGANTSLTGADDFVRNFYENKIYIRDTYLMIDLTTPIGGDHMYMYYDEGKTVHGEFFDKIASDKKMDFAKVPNYKRQMSGTITMDQFVPYTHPGILSSNIFFLNKRIPSVNFISFDWDNNGVGKMVERSGKNNISNTSADNYENFVELVGKDRIVKETDMVYTTIVSALTDDAFVATMQESINNMPSYKAVTSIYLIYGLRFGLAFVLILAAALISSKLKKDLPMLPLDQFMRDLGATPMNVTSPPKNDNGNGNDNNIDPFGLGDDNAPSSGSNDNNPNNKDAGDDIFGL